MKELDHNDSLMLTLSVSQIRTILSSVSDGSVDSLETDVTIFYRGAWIDEEGNTNPAGLYWCFSEYPEEGVFGPLNHDDSMCYYCGKDWGSHDFGVPKPYCPV